MKITISIDEDVNFYYWVQAMSGWSIYHAEKDIYSFYREISNDLTDDDYHILRKVSDILSTSTNPRRVLFSLYEKRVDLPEAKEIERLSRSLKTTFKKIWIKEKDALEQHKSDLHMFDTSIVANEMAKVCRFLDSSFELNDTVSVCLLMNFEDGPAIGHALEESPFILLHPCGIKAKNYLSRTRTTLLHEYIHLIEFKSRTTDALFKESYDKYIKPKDINPPQSSSWKMLYKECIVQVFANNITGGYFKQYTYNLPAPSVSDMEDSFKKLYADQKASISHITSWIALNVTNDAALYMEQGKTIDPTYITHMSKLFLELY